MNDLIEVPRNRVKTLSCRLRISKWDAMTIREDSFSAFNEEVIVDLLGQAISEKLVEYKKYLISVTNDNPDYFDLVAQFEIIVPEVPRDE